METWIYSIAGAGLVSLLSLVGGVGLLLREAFLKKTVTVLVGLAVGVLLGDAFVHLLPEAVELTEAPRTVSVLVLAGVLVFFALEKIVKWRHSHALTVSKRGQNIRSYAHMCLIGDAVHNFVDGAIIASSFLVSPTIGIASTIAIIAHEVPQEIGDVAILVHGGFSTRRSIWLNFLCALTVIPGALCTLLFSLPFAAFAVYLLPIAAGGFIYIAASDLIPQLQEDVAPKMQFAQGAAIVAGLVFIAGALVLEERMEGRSQGYIPATVSLSQVNSSVDKPEVSVSVALQRNSMLAANS
jgi:zinc and cadmium transporter